MIRLTALNTSPKNSALELDALFFAELVQRLEEAAVQDAKE